MIKNKKTKILRFLNDIFITDSFFSKKINDQVSFSDISGFKHVILEYITPYCISKWSCYAQIPYP